MKKRLGKIETVKFGLGAYQGAMIGLHVKLGGVDGWGVCDTKSAWDPEIVEHSKHCKWTENSRDKLFAEIIRYISKLLKQAKVQTIDQLKGIPIEATFDGNTLKKWRILEEVL